MVAPDLRPDDSRSDHAAEDALCKRRRTLDSTRLLLET